MSKIASFRWFYIFPLPDGSKTEQFVWGNVTREDRALLHETRLQMLNNELDRLAQDGKSPQSAIDIGCHQGWFSFHLAQHGCPQILGIDARQEHIDAANCIKEIHGDNRLTYQVGDIQALNPESYGRFDLVLMLGLIYHLDNPVQALQKARALCKDTLIIESQVMPNLQARIDWGSYLHGRDIQGIFGIVDEGDSSFHSDGVTGLALVPSCQGLIWILQKLGFTKISILTPPAGAHEQLLMGKRVMISAQL